MSRRIYYAEGGGPLGGAYALIELEVERETAKSYLLANNGRGEALVGATTYVGRTLRKSALGTGKRVFEKPRTAVEWLRECMEAELRQLRLRQERVQAQSDQLQAVLAEAEAQSQAMLAEAEARSQAVRAKAKAQRRAEQEPAEGGDGDK